jgi:hypothetical protein
MVPDKTFLHQPLLKSKHQQYSLPHRPVHVKHRRKMPENV